MSSDFHNPNAGRHIPLKQEGWPFAIFVVFLAIASAAGATYVHNKTYKHPTDIRFHAAGTEGMAPAAAHAEAAAPASH